MRGRPIEAVRPSALAGLLAVAAGAAPAQAPGPAVVRLPPVTVSTTRIDAAAGDVPASVSVRHGDALEPGRQRLGLDESLVSVPGVFAQNRWNFAQDLRLSVRGFGARGNFGIRGLRVLVDGFPATSPDGQTTLDDVDPAAIERIEILRGPAASAWGAASGGVIRLDTAPPGGPGEVQAEVSAGANGFVRTALATRGERGALGWSARAGRTAVDGHRDNAQAESATGQLRLRWRGNAGTVLDVVAAGVDAPIAQDPGGLTAAEAGAAPGRAAPLHLRFDAGESVAQRRLGMAVESALTGGATARLRVHALERSFSNKLPFSATAFDRLAAGLGAEVEATLIAGPTTHRVLVGVDAERQRDDRSRFANADGVIGAPTARQVETVGAIGLFAQDVVRLAPALRLELGLRYDEVAFEVRDRFLADGDDSGRRRFSQWSPSAALGFEPAPGHLLWTRAASAFETPTTTELADPTGAGGFNRALAPATALGVEIGARGAAAGGRLSWEVVGWRIDGEDELVATPIPGQPGRFAFVNAGASRRSGVELGIAAELAPGLSARVAATWSESVLERFTDAAGNRLDGNHVPGAPGHVVGAEVSWFGASGLFAGADARWVGAFFADDANTVKVDAHAVASVRAGYEREGRDWAVRLSAGVDNVLDERWFANVRINAAGGRHFEPAPGRNAWVGLTVTRHF